MLAVAEWKTQRKPWQDEMRAIEPNHLAPYSYAGQWYMRNASAQVQILAASTLKEIKHVNQKSTQKSTESVPGDREERRSS